MKRFLLFLFLSLLISNLNLFAQIIFVEDIIDVPDTAIVGVSLPLTGTVIPENATFQYIIWTIFDAGTTGATITGNILHIDAEGTVIITAKITESAMGDGFTKNFVIEAFNYVPVEDIIDVPDTAIVGVPLPLICTVIPENATHQNIIWSVFYAGSTGAIITENMLHTNATGTVVLTATIIETLVGKSFTKYFVIEVTELVGTNDIEFVNIKIYPVPVKDELRMENGEMSINNLEIFDTFGRKFYSSACPLMYSSTIDISHLPAGVYFVKINTEAGQVIRKVLKE